MIGREILDRSRDIIDHGVVDFARHHRAAVTFGKRDDTDRQRRPADNVGSRRPAADAARPAEPDQFGRSAADVEQDDARSRRIEQFRAAGRRQPCLGGGIDDFQFEAGFRGDAGAERFAVLGGAASLGGDQPRAHHAARPHLVAADQQRIDRALDRRLADTARSRHALAETDNARERVDDTKPVRRRPRDQQPAIVGAEIERGVGRPRSARSRTLEHHHRAWAIAADAVRRSATASGPPS